MSGRRNFWINPEQSGGSAGLLLARVEELRERLRQEDPARLAVRCGAVWAPAHSGGSLRMNLWDQAITVTCPDFIAQDVVTGKMQGAAIQALLAYYLVTSDGAPQEGRWISFSELPDGRFYNQAFQGYTGRELGQFFGDDLERFLDCARACAGMPGSMGDASCAFQMLPRVSLAVVAWRGDEDFPSAYQVLFDAAVARHLPTDACAIAGSMLTRRLISAGSKSG